MTTNEPASPSSAAADSEDEATSDKGGEIEAAPDGESSAGEDVGERPRPTTVERAEDLWNDKVHF